MDPGNTNQRDAVTQQGALAQEPLRLHYLDWLQVLAILGVFLFHVTHPFDQLGDWIIKDTETTWVLNFSAVFSIPGGCRSSF